MESLIECPSEVSSVSRPQVSSKGVAPGGAQWVRGREESREESTLRRWMCAEEPQAPGQFWAGSWQALKPVRPQPPPHWRSWGGNVQQQEEVGEGWAVQLVSSFCGSNSSLKERWGCEWLGRSGGAGCSISPHHHHGWAVRRWHSWAQWLFSRCLACSGRSLEPLMFFCAAVAARSRPSRNPGALLAG